MTRLALLIAALWLSACAAQINKPIRPGDSWPDRAVAVDSTIMR